MRDRQTDRQPGQSPHEKRIRFQAQHKIFVFFSGFVSFCFFSFFSFFFSFFCIPSFWLLSCIVYSSGPSIFTLFTLIFLCRAFCFMLHSVPPPSLCHHASAAAGNLFDCWTACISLYFFGYVCRSRRERERRGEREGEREAAAYILLVLVVDIYFMSQITFIGTWHTLEIHV